MNLLAMITRFLALKAQKTVIDAELDAIKAELSDYVRTCDRAIETGKTRKLACGQYVLKLTHCIRPGFDEKRLRAERPDIVAEYGKVTEYDTLSA